eukprot:351983-Chlamydomonas_euryale.AAC.3
MLTRCFWPPDRVTPRSPISVRSPPCRMSRSAPSCATSSACGWEQVFWVGSIQEPEGLVGSNQEEVFWVGSI